MPEIMISYSHDDAKLAARIERQLTSAGYKVWRDISSIPGSAEWDIAIQQAIERCALVVVIVTQAALNSKWVRRELVYAETQGKPIFPLVFEIVKLPLVLITTHHISFVDDPKRAARMLLEQLPGLLKEDVRPPQREKGISLRQLRHILLFEAREKND